MFSEYIATIRRVGIAHLNMLKLAGSARPTKIPRLNGKVRRGRIYQLGESSSANNSSNLPLTHASLRCNR